MFHDNESLKAEIQGYPITAAAWRLVTTACTLTDADRRESAIDAMMSDVRMLDAAGQLRHVVAALAMVAATAMNHDELAAEQVQLAAETKGEFAGIVAECARQLAAEDGETFSL